MDKKSLGKNDRDKNVNRLTLFLTTLSKSEQKPNWENSLIHK